jgi:hypothetical protein
MPSCDVHLQNVHHVAGAFVASRFLLPRVAIIACSERVQTWNSSAFANNQAFRWFASEIDCSSSLHL